MDDKASQPQQQSTQASEDLAFIDDEENALRLGCGKCGDFLIKVWPTGLVRIEVNCKAPTCRRTNHVVLNRDGAQCYVERQWTEVRAPRIKG